MTQALSSESIDRLKNDGILFPIPVFSAEEITEYRAKLENLARQEGGKLSRATNQKPHLLLPWLNRMIRDPRILGPVSTVLGPTSSAGAPVSSGNNPMTPRSFPGTRIRPIGVCRLPTS